LAWEPQTTFAIGASPRPRDPLAPAGGCLRILLVVLLVAAQLLAPKAAAAQQDSAGEYEIKAAMLYNLMEFVDWPPSAYASAQSPDVLCVLGWDPFGNSLASLVSDKTIDGRPVQIRHVKNGEQIRACHVLYISSSERKRLGEILSNLSGASVLTVGEMSQFAERGGMIQFTLEDKQVHFQVNLDAASRSGLKISARLLALARVLKYTSGDSRLPGSATALVACERQRFFFANPRRELAGKLAGTDRWRA
jgi:hypothetical protein